MKRTFVIVVCTVLVGCLGAKTITDVLVKKLLAECIAENAYLGDVELQNVCKFADDVWPVVRDLVAAQKRGAAKAAAAAQSVKDAGKD